MALEASKMDEHEQRYHRRQRCMPLHWKRQFCGTEMAPPGTRANGFGPPIGSIGCFINQEIWQGDI